MMNHMADSVAQHAEGNSNLELSNVALSQPPLELPTSVWGETPSVTARFRNDANKCCKEIEKVFKLPQKALEGYPFPTRDIFDSLRLHGLAITVQCKAASFLESSPGLNPEALKNLLIQSSESGRAYTLIKKSPLGEAIHNGSKNKLTSREDLTCLAPAFIGAIRSKCGTSAGEKAARLTYSIPESDPEELTRELEQMAQRELVDEVEKIFSYRFKNKSLALLPLALSEYPDGDFGFLSPSLATLGFLTLERLATKLFIEDSDFRKAAFRERVRLKPGDMAKFAARLVSNSEISNQLSYLLSQRLEYMPKYSTSVASMLPRYIASIYYDGGESRLKKVLTI